MYTPSGKSIFFWVPRDIADGTPEGIADAIAELGLNDVNIKLGSGVYPYPYDIDMLPYINAIRARNPNIKVRGWHYVYDANDPEFEARAAIQQIQYLDLDGYCYDVEAHYKNHPDRANKAVELMQRTRSETVQRNIPLGITSYRIPSYHREIPWQAFLEFCDYIEPQNYWSQGISPAYDISRMVDEYLLLFNQYNIDPLPIIPAGRAYYYSDGYPSPGPPASEIITFMETCKNWNGAKGVNITGFSFWELGRMYVQTNGMIRFDAIADFEWDAETPQPPPPPEGLEERVLLLEEQMAAVLDIVSMHTVEITALNGTLAENETTINDHEERITTLEENEPEPPSNTITVRALERFPLGIAVAHDDKCSGQDPPGKPTIEHPPVEDRIIKQAGDEFEVYASGVYSCKDTPSTPVVLAAGRAEYYMAVNGYPEQAYTFVDATKVEIV